MNRKRVLAIAVLAILVAVVLVVFAETIPANAFLFAP